MRRPGASARFLARLVLMGQGRQVRVSFGGSQVSCSGLVEISCAGPWWVRRTMQWISGVDSVSGHALDWFVDGEHRRHGQCSGGAR